MKKFITAAALIAAGTAFSNAATIVLDETSAAYAVVLLDVTEFSDHNGSGFSGSSEVQNLIKYVGTWDTSGFSGSIGIVNNGSSSSHETGFYGSYTRVVVTDESTSTGSSLAMKLGNLSGSVFTNDTNWDSISAIALAYSFDATASSSYTATYGAVTILYTDGSYSTISGSSTDYKFTNVPVDYAFTATSIETTADGDVFEYGSIAKSTTELAGLTEAAVLSTIPEPSAFGLLAGVGALALVAARRRRSK